MPSRSRRATAGMRTTKTSSDLTMPVALAAELPVLLVRLGVVYVRLKGKRRGGVRRFRRTLLRGGLSPEAADGLVAEYESYGRLRTYLPEGLHIPSLPFKL